MYLCYYIRVNIPPKIPVESKKMMLKVYDYFVAESKLVLLSIHGNIPIKEPLIVLIFLWIP
jgi:hypothetical protein